MIKISRLADYATIIMDAFCKVPEKQLSATTLAHNTHITLSTVSKILKKLCEVDLLTSTRGVNGGYRLARPAKTITIAEIITAIDGRPAMTQCSLNDALCHFNQSCLLRSNWQQINRVIYKFLDSLTLMDMHYPLEQTLASEMEKKLEIDHEKK